MQPAAPPLAMEGTHRVRIASGLLPEEASAVNRRARALKRRRGEAGPGLRMNFGVYLFTGPHHRARRTDDDG